jgi:RNA polymerase sigma factor (sigma-70 family)
VLESSATVATTSAVLARQRARPAVHSGPVRRKPTTYERRAPGSGVAAPLSAFASHEELGRALIERRPDALPAAWRRYYPMVHRILRRALSTDGDVEDVAQDVFLCLLRRAHALRDSAAVCAFIVGITRHTLHREIKRRKRRRELAVESGLQARDATGVGAGPAESYASIRLNRLLQRLTEQERSSFVLRFGLGMTVPEVADALRVSEPTAKRRLSQARACLSVWAANDPFLSSYLRGGETGLGAAMDC